MVGLCGRRRVERGVGRGRERVGVGHALDEGGVDGEPAVDLRAGGCSGRQRGWSREGARRGGGRADLAEEGVVVGDEVAVVFREGVEVGAALLVGGEGVALVEVKGGLDGGLVVLLDAVRVGAVVVVVVVRVWVRVGVRVRLVVGVRVRHAGVGEGRRESSG